MSVRLQVLPVEFDVDEAQAPRVPFSGLDTVWFQLTGTLCNIACRHCFITCGPKEDRVPMLTRAEVLRYLAEAVQLGVRDYYFTGGEPMLHPEFWPLVEAVLAAGPLTVLSNGILIDAANAKIARRVFESSRYSFDLRISLDGMNASENDPVRGRGTFEQISAGIRTLAAEDISPTITVVEHAVGLGAADARARFIEFARGLGLKRPRIKFLPLLRLGRESRRTHGYATDDLAVLTAGAVDPAVVANLVCTSSRLVAAGGVMTCPILLDAPGARLGSTLAETLHPISLRWAACHTCVVDGLTCRT